MIGVHTHYVTTTPLDDEGIAKDLAHSESLVWSEAYSDYVFGGSWKSCMLFARGGENGDGVVTHYDHDRPPAFTRNGDELPHLRALISGVADLDRLNFVRLAKVTNSVIIPHRDLLELSELPDDTRNAHRMHIPLVTDEHSFFTEDDTVFRMRRGEVWFLDASQIHSVAVLSGIQRVHLMFDFVDRPSERPLLTVDTDPGDAPIPAHSVVNRPSLTADERARLLQLADVLTIETFNEVFSIVIKQHFRRDGGAGFVWDTMTAVADAAADPAVAEHTRELRRHYTLERSA